MYSDLMNSVVEYIMQQQRGGSSVVSVTSTSAFIGKFLFANWEQSAWGRTSTEGISVVHDCTESIIYSYILCAMNIEIRSSKFIEAQKTMPLNIETLLRLRKNL